jgi:hypothetical protein
MRHIHFVVFVALCALALGCEQSDPADADGAGGESAAGGGSAAGAGGSTGSAGGGPSVGDGAGGEGAGGEAAGGEAAGGGGDEMPPDDLCIPSRPEWDATIRPRVETLCGDCHGETPQFGSPYGLLDYEALLVGEPGRRRVDRIAARLRIGTMPPASKPQPTGDERRTIIDWATCGEDDSPPDGPVMGGFDVDRPVLGDPGEPPEDTDFFEVRADEFPVRKNWSNHYECFTVTAPVNEERFIRRIETVIDDARVLHHTVLIPGESALEPGTHGRCDNDNPLELLYGWAPGQGALHFEEGGIRLRPGETLTLQIHYNNSAGHEDVRDSSGVRIYHGPVEGPEVGMVTLGPLGFAIPPRSVGEAEGYCQLPRDTQLIASFPHMHEMGERFEQTIVRKDGTTEPLITLLGWDFESQFIYETPVDLEAGDAIITRCTFRNEYDRPLRFGPNTEDEMCFNFAYISPPLERGICDGPNPNRLPPYEAGRCAPASSEGIEPPVVIGDLVQGSTPDQSGGGLPSGLMVLDTLGIYLPTFNLGPVMLDPDQSRIAARGFLEINEGVMALDVLADVFFSDGALGFDQEINISLAGEVSEGSGSAASLSPTCGEGFDAFRYTTLPGGGIEIAAGVRMFNNTIPVALRFVPLP